MAEATMVRRDGWWSVVVERLALPPLILMAAALSSSVQLLASGRVRVGPLLVTVAGVTALLALLRLMDDLKDLEKDRIAHPGRPLARGALSRDRAESGVEAGVSALLGGAAMLALLGSAPAGVWLALCALWAFLMYREFFAPALLGRRPILYAVSHQLIVLPLYGFAAATAGGGATASPELWWFAATGLGASFTWEVCRKLDPEADPVLGTYRHRLGLGPALALATAFVALVSVAARPIGLEAVLWPPAALVLVGLVLAGLRPSAHRFAAGAAGLLAGVQPLAPLLDHLWRGS
jgi:4-hydroxybenzoate polyprenyltransferase